MQITIPQLVSIVTGVATSTATSIVLVTEITTAAAFLACGITAIITGASMAGIPIAYAAADRSKQRQLDAMDQLLTQRLSRLEVMTGGLDRITAELTDQMGRLVKAQRTIMEATRGIAASASPPEGGDTGTTGPQRLKVAR